MTVKNIALILKFFYLLLVQNWYRPKPGPGPAAFLSHKFTTLL